MSSRELPIPPQTALQTTAVPFLALAGTTLFPGTLLPLHAWEQSVCRLLSDCLAGRRLLALSGSPLSTQDSSHRTRGRVVGLGRAVSDRRYPDGRIDVFVHGLARATVIHLSDGPHGPIADLDLCPDQGEPTRDAAERLLTVSRLYAASATGEEALAMDSLLGSSRDPSVLSNRLAAGFVEPFALRQELLETTSPSLRCALLTAHLGERLLALTAPRGPLH